MNSPRDSLITVDDVAEAVGNVSIQRESIMINDQSTYSLDHGLPSPW